MSGGNLENNQVTADSNAASNIIGQKVAGGIVGLMESSTVQNNISYAVISSDTINKGGVVGKLDSASYTINNNGYANAEHGIGDNAQGVPGEEGCYKLGASISITTNARLASADAGINYSITLETDAPTGSVVTWSLPAGNSLPDGLSLNSSTGLISGTPTTAGTYTFTVQAVSGSAPATKEFTLTVRLVINTASALPTGTVGQQYSQNLSATGARNVTWALVQESSLPSGLELNNGRIFGTPTQAVNAAQFTIVASAGNNISASRTFILTIRASATEPIIPTPGGIINITTSSLPAGTVGRAYEQTLESDTPGSTWSILSGNLPGGLNLTSSNGRISGTPIAAGTFYFTARAVSGTASGDKALSITINANENPNQNPNQNPSNPNEPLGLIPSISTTYLEYAYVDYYYEETLNATGEDIIWSIVSGYLPEGLELDSRTGIISGYPYYEGYYPFTVKAENSNGSDTQELSISVYGEHHNDNVNSDGSDGGGGGGGCNSGIGILGLTILTFVGISKRKKY